MAILPAVKKKTKSGIEVTIENPSTDDARELLEVASRIMSESKHLLTLTDEFKDTVEMQEKRIRKFEENIDGLLLVAKVDGQIVGMTDFEVGFRRRISHHGTLGISFLPEFTGKGLGQLLMIELIDWAKKHPRIETLRLHVHSKNTAAIVLYKKLGFVVEGTEVRGIKFENGTYDNVFTMALFVKDSSNSSMIMRRD